MYALTITTEPTEEPITLAEVKDQLRISSSVEDTFLTRLITAARKNVEHHLGRAIITQTLDLYLDRFPSIDAMPIVLPRPPLASISSIKYYDNADVEQTWSSGEYTVNTDARNGEVYPSRTYSWPTTRDFPKAVNVTYVAGYGAAADVPEDIKQAILLMVGHFERQREATTDLSIVPIPLGAAALLAPYKVFAV